MPENSLRLAVIVSSTRQGRFGGGAAWSVAEARQRDAWVLRLAGPDLRRDDAEGVKRAERSMPTQVSGSVMRVLSTSTPSDPQAHVHQGRSRS